MTTVIPRTGLFILVLALYGPAFAAASDRPAAGHEQPRPLIVFPERIDLCGGDDARQLLVTATLADGRLQDLTSDVTYEIADAAVATVLPGGRVRPLANGATTLTVR